MELCAYYLISCVLGMERKQAEQFSLCPVTKKESFKNTVNRSEKPHTESPGESGVKVSQERKGKSRITAASIKRDFDLSIGNYYLR